MYYIMLSGKQFVKIKVFFHVLIDAHFKYLGGYVPSVLPEIYVFQVL